MSLFVPKGKLSGPSTGIDGSRDDCAIKSGENGEGLADRSSSTSKRSRFTSVPPIIFLLFGTSIDTAEASPLNQQAILLRSPFFQGWLVRMIDHSKGGSFIFIVGSFSEQGSKQYDEHYIFCGIDMPYPKNSRISSKSLYNYHIEAFPDPNTVVIEGGMLLKDSRFNMLSRHIPTLNITWSAQGLGKFVFQGNTCNADMKIENVHIKFNAENRTPWNKNDPVKDGPEGWLGYTSLLPCHYFVHSVGSPCDYNIKIDEGTKMFDVPSLLSPIPPACLPFERDDDFSLLTQHALSPVSSSIVSKLYERALLPIMGATGDDDDNFSLSQNCPSSIRHINGSGFAHIEGNHGTFFPAGWVWSQGINEHNNVSMSLVSGRFSIGGLSPVNTILYIRLGKETFVFRTTDLDRIKIRTLDSTSGKISLTAESLARSHRIDLDIVGPKGWIANAIPVHIPTKSGFSNEPGCRETYVATAKITLWRQVNPLVKRYTKKGEYELPKTALEFGNQYLSKI